MNHACVCYMCTTCETSITFAQSCHGRYIIQDICTIPQADLREGSRGRRPPFFLVFSKCFCLKRFLKSEVFIRGGGGGGDSAPSFCTFWIRTWTRLFILITNYSITQNEIVAYESITCGISLLTIRASLATWEERSASNTFW